MYCGLKSTRGVCVMNGGAPKVWGLRVDVLWPHVKVAVCINTLQKFACCVT